MWKLVRLTLAYHRKPLLWTLVIALLLTEPGLVILAIVAIVLVSAEDKERRLLLHLPLPVTRTQVGWARVVFPATVLVLGTAVVAIFSAAILLALSSTTTLFGGATTTVAQATREPLFFATGLMFFSQLLLTLGELNVWGTGHGLSRLLRAFATLVALLVITIMAGVALATSGSYLVVALGTAALTLGLMGLTVYLFQQRPSFTSG